MAEEEIKKLLKEGTLVLGADVVLKKLKKEIEESKEKR